MAGGQSLLDPSATTRLMARLRAGQQPEAEPDALPGLTEREREILALIGEGLTNRQIGRRLYLAEKTVKNHISRLLASSAWNAGSRPPSSPPRPRTACAANGADRAARDPARRPPVSSRSAGAR